MLKKQTVWLLTMISLMIVLSVYYMMSDRDELAYTTNDSSEVDQSVPEAGLDTEADVEVNEVNSLEGSELFTTIRMKLEDERSLKKDRLRDTIASSTANASEINEALNDIDLLENTETKEEILQETILSTDNAYEDVLVRSEGEKVHVHVITEELSKEAAAHIMQMIIDELGPVTVDVNFQPVNS